LYFVFVVIIHYVHFMIMQYLVIFAVITYTYMCNKNILKYIGYCNTELAYKYTNAILYLFTLW